MQPDFKDFLKESARHLNIADHMTHVTFPIVNEKRLILKIFEEIYKSIMNSINFAVLNRFTNNEIESNLFYFIDSISKKINLDENNIKKIKEIMEIENKYKKSAMNFVKKDKIVILSDSLAIHTLTIENIKEYLLIAKELFMNVSNSKK